MSTTERISGLMHEKQQESKNGIEISAAKERLSKIQQFEWIPFSVETYGKTSHIEDIENIMLANNGYSIDDKDSLLNPRIPTAEESGLDLLSLYTVGERLIEAKKKNQRVLIYGDSDFDGVASTYILYQLFKNFGIEQVKTYCPTRDEYGYGFNDNAAEVFAVDYDLIVTVDCGITARDQVNKVKEKGKDVIIIDHHKIQEEEYPDNATAVLHTTETSAAGIAYLLTEFYGDKYGIDKADIIGIAGPAVYADNMAMTRVSRPIVRASYKAIRKEAPEYISALMYGNPKSIPDFTDSDISFTISPIMNTPGRFGNPQLALKLLRSNDDAERKRLAGNMKNLNKRRKAIGEEILYTIRQEIKKGNIDPKYLLYMVDGEQYGIPPTFIDSLVTRTVMNPNVNRVVLLGMFHQSKEFEEKVAVYQCRGPFGTVNLIPFIELMKENGLIRGGGHAGAVGFTHFASKHELVKSLATEYLEEAIPVLPPATQQIFYELPLKMENISEINELQKQYAPFSFGFEKPTIMSRGIEVTKVEIKNNSNFEKSKHLHVTFRDSDGNEIKGVEFNALEEHLKIQSGDVIDIVYKVGESTFDNETFIQLSLEDFRESTGEEIPEYIPPPPTRHDYQPFELPQEPIIYLPEEMKQLLPKINLVGFDMDDTLIMNNTINLYRHLFFEAWALTKDEYFREIYATAAFESTGWKEAIHRVKQVSYEHYVNKEDGMFIEISPEERIHHHAKVHAQSIRTDEERGEHYAKLLGFASGEEFWEFFMDRFNRGMDRRVDEFKIVTPGAVDLLNYLTEDLNIDTFLISNSKSSELLNTEELLRQEGFKGRFMKKISARSMGHEKPDPHSLRNIFLDRPMESHTVAYFGNTIGDIQFTRNFYNLENYPTTHNINYKNIEFIPIIINQGLDYSDLNIAYPHIQFDSLITGKQVLQENLQPT